MYLTLVACIPFEYNIQQNVNEDNISYSQNQEPIENIPIEQIDHINTKSQKRKCPDITADKPLWNQALALLS